MVTGPIKLAVSGGFNLGKFLLKYWWLLATLIILIPMLVSSINQGIEEKDIKIPLKTIGMILGSSDQKIYDTVQDLEFEPQKKEELSEKIDYYFAFSWYLIKNLWGPIWMLIFSYIIFYKFFLFILGDSSKKLRAFLVSIMVMCGLQILIGGWPFKGTYALIKFIITSIREV